MEARGGRRSHNDVLGDFAIAEVVIDRCTHVVRSVDDPFLKGWIDFPTRKEHGGDTSGTIDISDDPHPDSGSSFP